MLLLRKQPIIVKQWISIEHKLENGKINLPHAIPINHGQLQVRQSQHEHRCADVMNELEQWDTKRTKLPTKIILPWRTTVKCNFKLILSLSNSLFPKSLLINVYKHGTPNVPIITPRARPPSSFRKIHPSSPSSLASLRSKAPHHR